MNWMDFVIFFSIFLFSFCAVHSGGMGLLSRLFLILLGIPPEITLGSFRVANLGGRMSSFSVLMQRHGMKMDWNLVFWLFLSSAIGGFAGAQLIKMLPAEVLKKIIGSFVIVMGVVVLLRPEVGLVERQERITKAKHTIGFIATIVIAVLSTFVGGVGVLFTYLLMFVYNKSYLASAPIRKMANCASALTASVLFMIYGLVQWKLAVIIFIAGMLGEFVGGKFFFHKKRLEWLHAIASGLIFIAGIAMLFF